MGLSDYAAIVKAAPQLRQHFCLFLRVNRDRSRFNSPIWKRQSER
jgi:hypothetical protein